MSFSLPPIAKAAENLLVSIEQAVRRFPRYHRYTAGTDLRAKAKEVSVLVHRAWRDKRRQVEWTRHLIFAIDGLKIELQLCSRLQAFGSFAQFELLIRMAKDIGKQAGGWYRQQIGSHPKGQNAQGNPVAQRAQKLSTRGTSSMWEVYP